MPKSKKSPLKQPTPAAGGATMFTGGHVPAWVNLSSPTFWTSLGGSMFGTSKGTRKTKSKGFSMKSPYKK